MLSITAREDISIENRRISAGAEIAVVDTTLGPEVIFELLRRPDLIEATEQASEQDPPERLSLPIGKLVATLTADEAQGLLQLLAKRLGIDKNDDAPLAENENLFFVFLGHPELTAAAGSLSQAGIDRVGQLRGWLASGRNLADVAGIDEELAERIAAVPGLLIEQDAAGDDEAPELDDDTAADAEALIAEDAWLVQAFNWGGLPHTLADACSHAHINTVGQLRQHVESGKALEEIPGIDEAAAARIADVPGLLPALAK